MEGVSWANLLVMQLVIVFIPGLIWARLDCIYALRRETETAVFVVRTFIFGIISYCAAYGVFSGLGWSFILVDLTQAGQKTVLTGAIIKEILIASLCAFFLSVLWIYSARFKLLNRFLRGIQATSKYGDEDLWDYTFNLGIAAVEYVHYRDYEQNLTYAGWVVAYSEKENMRELVLRDVEVYSADGVKQYDAPMLYLARKPENINIEFPYRKT
jgi:hypothetical protein